MRGLNHDFISGSLLSLVGAGALILAYRLGIGTLREPGAGLIPFGAAALLFLMCLGLAIKGLLEERTARHRDAVFRGIKWGTPVLVLCALLGYGIAFNRLGFRISTFLFTLLLLTMVGRRRWWLTVSYSILIVIAIYLIFVVWLGCELPRGFLRI